MKKSKSVVRKRAFASREPAAVAARILRAAQAEFMALGFEAASTNTITAAFGGSKATLFRYFPTKEALLEAVVQSIVSGWHDAVQWEAIGETKPGSWLTAFGDLTLRWLLSDEPIFVGRLVVTDGKRFPTLRRMWVEHASRPILAAIAGQLQMWTEQGVLVSFAPEEDARRFVTLMFSGAVSNAQYGAPPLRGRALIDHVESSVEFFIRAVSRP